MEYTTRLNLKKPQETDVVRVEDFNENADTLDTMVGRVLPSRQGLQWENLVYRNGTPAWCGSLYNTIWISETVINKTGNVSNIASLPIGWNVEYLTGIWVEGYLDCTDIRATQAGANPYLSFDFHPLSGTFYVPNDEYTGTNVVNKSFTFQAMIPVTGTMDGVMQIGMKNVDFDDVSARGPNCAKGGTLTVVNDMVSEITGCNLKFIGSGWQEISATSVTGKIRLYAVKGVAGVSV